MKRIALYGYGTYGKRASESFRFFWRGDPAVTAIFDRPPTGTPTSVILVDDDLGY